MDPSNPPVSADVPENKPELRASNDSGDPGRHGALTLAVAGVLGALVAWVVLAEFRPYFQHAQRGQAPPNEETQALARRDALLNTVSAFAIVGAAMVVCVVAGESLSRRSWRMLAIAAPVGLVLGAGAGALGGWAGYCVQTGSSLGLIDLAKSAVQQVTVWGIIGIGMGIAMPPRRLTAWVNAVVAAALGGGFAALIYVATVAFFFPDVSAEALLPDSHAQRLAIFCLNGLLMGGFVGLVTTEKASKVKSV